MSLSCGVTIATHNRKEDLAATLGAIAQLPVQPDEVIICADGCTDDTAAFVRAEYPGHRLLINPASQGSITSRDAMMRQSRCDVLLSLDDDSHPIEPDFFVTLGTLFQREPRLAVLSFPQRSDEFPESLTATDFGPPQFVGTFWNSGAAIRRAAFLELGGYPGWFWHAYEEPDFALRSVASGWTVRTEPALTIRHRYTRALRNECRTHHFHARNELWSVMMRCPAPYLFPVLLFRAARQFGYAKKRGLGWLIREPLWWAKFAAGIPKCIAERRPIAWRRYRAWMQLVRHPISSEIEWTAKFGKGRSTPGH